MVLLSPRMILVTGSLIAGALFVVPAGTTLRAETPSPSPTPTATGTPIAAPTPAPKGACYIWGEACKNGLTKEECRKKGWLGDDLPPFSFWKESATCYDKLLPAVEQASIDCKGRDIVRDASKIAEEVQKKCLEELKEKEKTEEEICKAKGEVLMVSYRLPGGWIYNLKLQQCVGSCAALLQCVDPKSFILI